MEDLKCTFAWLFRKIHYSSHCLTCWSGIKGPGLAFASGVKINHRLLLSASEFRLTCREDFLAAE